MSKFGKVLSVVLMLAMVFCITACGKDNSELVTEESQVSSADFVGTWKGTGNEISTLTLGANGSYKDVAGDVSIIGTYTINASEGTLTVNESEYGLVFTYAYELSGDNLTLQMNGGLPRTFAKQ